MKSNYLLFLCFFCSTALSAQLGLHAAYSQLSLGEWNDIFEESRFDFSNENLDRSFQYGVDYKFRLPKKRVEFFPTLAMANYQAIANNSAEEIAQLDLKNYQFTVNTNIYILNFDGDCDCPTFSKQEPIVQKGFFVQVSPGVSFSSHEFSLRETILKNNDFSFHIGLGIGLDIGVSKFLTVTPFARAKRHFGMDWEELNNSLTGTKPIAQEENTNMMQYEAGIRLGIHWKQY